MMLKIAYNADGTIKEFSCMERIKARIKDLKANEILVDASTVGRDFYSHYQDFRVVDGRLCHYTEL